MRYFLLFAGLIISTSGAGQADSLRLRVYSEFINAEIFEYDTMAKRKTELVFVTTTDSLEPFIDPEYLNDYLNDRIENNDAYKGSLIYRDPSGYFDMISKGLGQTLRKDRELGALILTLFKDNDLKSSEIESLASSYRTKVIRNPKPYFKMGWDAFHKKYQNCYGIIRLSKLTFNNQMDRAIMFAEIYRGRLNATGDIVLMRKVNEKWIVELTINHWMS